MASDFNREEIGIDESVKIYDKKSDPRAEGNILYDVLADGSYIAESVLDNTLTEYTLSDKTSKIYANAFKDCKNLTTITIPKSVTHINAQAFSGCSSLKEIIFEEGSQLVEIGNNAFQYTGLTSIIIPENVTSIGSGAFYQANSLVVVVNLSDLDIVCGVQGSPRSYLSEYADIVFKNKVELIETTAENGVIYNKYKAQDGEKFKIVTRDGEIELEQEFFKVAVRVVDQTKSTYTFATDTDAIGSDIFANNEYLTHITIPENVKSIGYSAFAECFNLAVVSNLNSFDITNIAHNVGDYGYISWYLGELYTTAIDVVEKTINNVKYLDVYDATDTSHTTLIDRVVVQADTSLNGEITLAEGTTVISYKAFDGVTSVTKVTLPESVRLIQYKGLGSIATVVLENSSGWEQANADPYDNTWSDLTSDEAASAIASKPKYVYRLK